jgi:hypothetical protein
MLLVDRGSPFRLLPWRNTSLQSKPYQLVIAIPRGSYSRLPRQIRLLGSRWRTISKSVNPSIHRLFEQYNYKVCPTGAEASNQNGPVERAHLNVANAIRAMLHGAALPAKFWPYAFHHFLRIKNATPSRGREMSPIEMTSGNKDNFSAFRTFGCRVWVRPTTKRPAKFHTVSRKGIFIGFIPDTTRNILWYDVESQLVKIAKHVQFDEGMNDMPLDAIPPNVQYLIRVQDGKPFPAEPKPTAVLQFCFRHTPFSKIVHKSFIVRCQQDNFGLSLATDDLSRRVYIQKISRASTIAKGYSTMKAAHNAIRGAFIHTIAGTPVFSLEDATSEFTKLREKDVASFSIDFAPERALTAHETRHAFVEHDLFRPNEPEAEQTPTLRTADIRAITSLRFPGVDVSIAALSTEEIQLANTPYPPTQ